MSIRAEERICQAAIELFGKYSYAEVSVRQIAEIAEVNPSLINYYFGGKEGLYRFLISHYGVTYAEDALSIISGEQEYASVNAYRQKFQEVAQSLINLINTHADLHRLVVREMMEGFPRAGEEYMVLVPGMQNHIANFISLGQKQGFVKKEIEPIYMAYLFLIVLLTPFERKPTVKKMTQYDLDNSKHRNKHIAQVMDVFLDGIVVK